jgi:hypothetical protein
MVVDSTISMMMLGSKKVLVIKLLSVNMHEVVGVIA